mgnify:CR=1 FL=1
MALVIVTSLSGEHICNNNSLLFYKCINSMHKFSSNHHVSLSYHHFYLTSLVSHFWGMSRLHRYLSSAISSFMFNFLIMSSSTTLATCRYPISNLYLWNISTPSLLLPDKAPIFISFQVMISLK